LNGSATDLPTNSLETGRALELLRDGPPMNGTDGTDPPMMTAWPGWTWDLPMND